jgi:putative glutamine amidotransferase
VAHTVTIEADSMLAEAVRNNARAAHESSSTTSIQDVPVNSSHHQAADAPGKGLRIVARCPVDGIVEALEGTDPAHFVVAVQWHPERSIDGDEPSRALFQSFVRAANEWRISNREQARESAR